MEVASGHQKWASKAGPRDLILSITEEEAAAQGLETKQTKP